jgi:DNA-binding LacI/PurR family transcriptional regulator
MVDGIITMNALSSLPELTTMIGDAPWVQCAEYADAGSISCVGINDVDGAGRRQPAGRRRAQTHRDDQPRSQLSLSRLRERGYKSVLHVRDLAYQQVTYASDLSAAAGKRAMERCCRKKSSRMRCLPFPIRWRRARCGPSPGRTAGAGGYCGGRL